MGHDVIKLRQIEIVRREIGSMKRCVLNTGFCSQASPMVDMLGQRVDADEAAVRRVAAMTTVVTPGHSRARTREASPSRRWRDARKASRRNRAKPVRAHGKNRAYRRCRQYNLWTVATMLAPASRVGL